MELDLLAKGFIKYDWFVPINTPHKRSFVFGFGSKMLVNSFTETVGGTAPNIATALAKLGWRTAVTGSIGNTPVAQKARAFLTQNNVDHSLLHTTNGAVRRCVVLYGKKDRVILTETTPTDHTPPPSHTRHALYTLIAEDDTPADEVLSWIATQNTTPTITAWNPGGSQWNWTTAQKHRLLQETTILCLNKEEARALIRKPRASIVSTLHTLHHMGPQLVAITDGKKGAYVSSESTVLYCPADPLVRPKETTGAGDAFFAGLLSGHGQQHSLTQQIARGIALSASVTEQIGPTDGLLTEHDLQQRTERLLPLVRPIT